MDNFFALLGDVILICINSVNMKKFIKLKAQLQKRFSVGSIHRALVVRTKVNYMRIKYIFFKFNENSMIIVSKNIVPLSNKVYGPILREFCMR
jgi:large subunit ribosomal protein L14